MRKSHNRAVIAARATASTPTPRVNSVPMLRPDSKPIRTGPVRRTTCAPLTAMQRDSTGKMSAWAASPYYFTDPKWSQTVQNQR